MGKKHKKKYKYTKHDFINICCSKCRICEEGTAPDLCYSKFYKNNPKEFIKEIFKNLLRLKHLANRNTYPGLYNIHLEYIFKNSFCTSNLCNKYVQDKQCDDLYKCVEAFKCQVKGRPIIGSCFLFDGTKQKKKKQRYVVQAYPSFFTNDSEVFHKEIKEILNKG